MPESESMLNRITGSLSVATLERPLPLQSGGSLSSVSIAFETYGRLAPGRDNAVLVCHALTGSAHAAGRDTDGQPGWWDPMIGSKRAIDTDRWFVVCSNVLGGCYGSTGPSSPGYCGQQEFPTITIRDMVRAQRRMLLALGVERLHGVVGGSMGGMQALEWAVSFPDFVERIVPIGAPAAHTPWAIGFNAIGREALALGEAAGDPTAGLRLARKVAMMTYRSGAEMRFRFGRNRTTSEHGRADGAFDVEQYLHRHGEKLASRFDNATYRTLTRAMDLHDVALGRGTMADVLGSVRARALVVGISTDQLYPAAEQRELARDLGAEYFEIQSPCGHDAFLIEHDQLGGVIRDFLERSNPASPKPSTLNTTGREAVRIEEVSA